MNFVKNLPRMHGEATVIARTVIDLNHHRRATKPSYPLSRPSRTVVERNGKQYVTEMKERIERRYVQIFDDNLGRMRLFEVTDYIPTRTIRSLPKRPGPLTAVASTQTYWHLPDEQADPPAPPPKVSLRQRSTTSSRYNQLSDPYTSSTFADQTEIDAMSQGFDPGGHLCPKYRSLFV